MASKPLFLSIPEPILQKLKEEKHKYSYSSVQELIITLLRNKYLLPPQSPTTNPLKPKKSHAGRPKKLDEGYIMSRKRIFNPKGVKINV